MKKKTIRGLEELIFVLMPSKPNMENGAPCIGCRRISPISPEYTFGFC